MNGVEERKKTHTKVDVPILPLRLHVTPGNPCCTAWEKDDCPVSEPCEVIRQPALTFMFRGASLAPRRFLYKK